jgi:hypothetical protein
MKKLREMMNREVMIGRAIIMSVIIFSVIHTVNSMKYPGKIMVVGRMRYWYQPSACRMSAKIFSLNASVISFHIHGTL